MDHQIISREGALHDIAFSLIECFDAELISIMVWSLTNALRESSNFESKGGIEILQFEEKMRTFTFFNFNVLRCPMKN